MATNHNNLNVARALRFLALVEPPKGDSLNYDEEFGRHMLLQCCADALESFIDEPVCFDALVGAYARQKEARDA